MGFYAFSNLDQSTLDEIQRLEQRIGKPLVAVQPVDMKPADLPDKDTLAAIKTLESKLGVSLVAVER